MKRLTALLLCFVASAFAASPQPVRLHGPIQWDSMALPKSMFASGSPQPFIIQIQNGGSSIGTFSNFMLLNCSTGTSCTASGSTVTLTASVSGLPSLPTAPNSVPQSITSTPSGGVGGAATWNLPGIAGRAITGSTATDMIVSTDCNPKRVEYVGSVAVAVTLPTATTLAVPNCVFKLVNNLSTVNDLMYRKNKNSFPK